MKSKIAKYSGELDQLINFSLESSEIALFYPARLNHIYIKLDSSYETSSNKSEAVKFISAVAKVAKICQLMLPKKRGLLLEVQGSMIHLVLPDRYNRAELNDFCAELHEKFSTVFSDSSNIKGLRIAIDCGKTVIIEAESIHNDSSLVSIGNSANRPAKYIYQQLSIGNEEDRDLKRNHIGFYEKNSGSWIVTSLDDLKQKITKTFFEEGSLVNFSQTVNESIRVQSFKQNVTKAQASPVPSEDTAKQGDVTPYYGWVMRADIDGFTRKVADCYDNDERLQALAENFRGVMHQCKLFADAHTEYMIQIPWAGDNFTAIAVYDNKKTYLANAQTKLVDLTLNFDSDLHVATQNAGFNGWAYAVAGGSVHGNAEGNIFVGDVHVDDRRLLIAGGRGVGRSIQAFLDIAPDLQEMAIYSEKKEGTELGDYYNLIDDYKKCFADNQKENGELSSLFRKSAISTLESASKNFASASDSDSNKYSTAITNGLGATIITKPRPYANYKA